MSRKSVRLVLGCATAHFLAMGSMLLLSLQGLDTFDDPTSTPSLGERVAGLGVEVLGFPAMHLWTVLGLGRSAPDLLEWAFVLANSLLWGCALAALVHAYSRRRSRGREAA